MFVVCYFDGDEVVMLFGLVLRVILVLFVILNVLFVWVRIVVILCVDSRDGVLLLKNIELSVG